MSKRVDIVRVVNFSNLSQLLKKRPSITKRKESSIYSGIVQLGSLMIPEKVTIFVLSLFLLSSLSTPGNIQSLALLLGDVTAFHHFTTGRETAGGIELASILTNSAFDSP